MGPAEVKDTALNVLLLEDNPQEAALVEHTLQTGWKASISIHHYMRVKEIASHLKHQTPDIILLDLNVLDSDGLNTVETVVQNNHGLCPIVVITSMKDQKKAIKALEMGAQEYVVKGEYSAESLTRAIRFARARVKSSGMPQGQGREELHLDGLTIDLMAQVITYHDGRDDHRMDLTPMELKLAAYFIKNIWSRFKAGKNFATTVWGRRGDHF